MDGKQLRNSILQWAIQGKLVPQDPNDEPASVLLERIREEKARLVKEKKIKRDKNESIIYRGDDNSYYEKFTATGEVKCIDDEITISIPETWVFVRLEDIVQINPKNDCEDSVEAAFIPMEKIDATYLSSFTFASKKWGEIKKGFTHFANGDVAFAKITPCFQNRKSMILKDLPNGVGAGTTELRVLRRYGNTIILEYLLFFLESPYFVDEATFKGTANQQRIITGYLEKKLFPLPPLAEQKRIVEMILQLFPVVARYEKSQNKLNLLNNNIKPYLEKSILQEAIQGRLVDQCETDESASVLLEKIRVEKKRLFNEGKLKKSALEDSVIFKGDDNKYFEKRGKEIKCIDDEIPFEIPESWQWIRGRFGFIPMESSKPDGNSFIYIDVAAVNNKNNQIEGAKELCSKDAPSRATRKLHLNDILFSMVRPYLRNIAIVTEDYSNAIASTGYYVITPSCGFYPEYLFFLMLSPYVVDGLNQFMKGDNSPSINNADIENFLYPLPPFNEQRRIVERINSLRQVL